MKSNIDISRTTDINFSCLLCLRRQRLQKIDISNTVAFLKFFDYILDNGIHLAQTMSLPQLDVCLDFITINGAKTLNIEDEYGLDVGKPANFLVLDADSPFEAVRQRADVLASVRNGKYLFKKSEPSYDIGLDVFRKTK